MARLKLLAVAAALAVAGCATEPPKGRVVLLPGHDGKIGKVAVSSRQGRTVLAVPYGSASVDASGKMSKAVLDAATVRRDFGAVLDALPPRPLFFRLFFEGNSEELTADSRDQAEHILEQIASRPEPEVVVIGHTDRNGPDSFNDRLSLQRATVVREKLVGRGVDPKRIRAEGRGEREPALPTADGVLEPSNRRVEIFVR